MGGRSVRSVIVPSSLSKTTISLLLAALAVLVTASLAMRDFIRDVRPTCASTLTEVVDSVEWTLVPRSGFKNMPLELVDRKTGPTDTTQPFRLVYDVDARAYPTRYENVRFEWVVPEGDRPCTCDSIRMKLEPGQTPFTATLQFERASQHYHVKVGDQELTFELKSSPSHHVQTARILSRRHLSLFVSFAAFLALGVAWLRQRKARAYAQFMHTWTEAELSEAQMIQSEAGEMLGTLSSGSRRRARPAGTVLVNPHALGGSGMYRDVPVIEPKDVAQGSHDTWLRATMIRLRDARALAILSALTSVLALAAHYFA